MRNSSRDRVVPGQSLYRRSSGRRRRPLGTKLLPVVCVLAWQAAAMAGSAAAQNLDDLCTGEPLDLHCGFDDDCSADVEPSRQPVLFVHGHDFEIGNSVANYRRNWWRKHEWKDTSRCNTPWTCFLPCTEQLQNFCYKTYQLPSLKDVFDHAPEGAPLGIEPYFLSFTDQHRAIKVDACLVGRAVERILLRHGDPQAEAVKVAIVGYSKGTISSRTYLKYLVDSRVGEPPHFAPVSEHVAISPPNHGLVFDRIQSDEWKLLLEWLGYDVNIDESLALRQLNNGYDEDCERFCCDPTPGTGTCTGQNAGQCDDYSVCQDAANDEICKESASLDFIAGLNGENDAGATPGGRAAAHPRGEGVLYLSLYDVDDAAGGDTFRDTSCQRFNPDGSRARRLKAKNDGPGAVNRHVEVPPENPSEFERLVVHGNAVHTPEVLCQALYTAAHRHVMPPELCVKPETEPEYEYTPVIPMDHPGVVLLLDVSGSMSRTPAGDLAGPGESRLDMAKSAATSFLQRLLDFFDDQAHFAVATFPVQPQDSRSHCQGQVRLPMSLVTGEAKTAAEAILGPLPAFGNTPMLGGLDKALATFGGEAGKAIVLLTDGEHNCPPGALPDSQIEALAASRVFVYPVDFGTPGESDPLFLQKLASGSGEANDCEDNPACKVGELTDVTEQLVPGSPWDPATALTEAFKNIFVTALGLQAGVDPQGSIGHDDAPVIRQVWVNEHDRRVSFALSWTKPSAERLGLRVFAPDGEILPAAAGVRLTRRATYTILTVGERFLSVPARRGPRPWRIEIHPSGLTPGETESFHYDMILDSALKMDVALDRRDYAAGDPVTLTAELTADGTPLTGARVTAEVSRPANGLGNWFAAHAVTPDELGQVPQERDGELLSRPQRKVRFLTRVRPTPLPGRHEPETVTLNDQGRDGDRQAGDGIYAARYAKTPREGTYVFHLRATNVRATDAVPAGGPFFERERVIHRYFTVRPTAEATTVRVERVPGGGDGGDERGRRFRVRVSPRDRLGNHLGPRHEQSIVIAASREIFVNGVEDHLDGSYGRVFELGDDNPGEIELTIDALGATQSFVLADKLPSSWAFSFHFGRTLPQGNLSGDFNDGLALGLDLERPITARLSAVGLLEYHGLQSTAAGVRDTWWWNLSANLKARGRRPSFPWYLAAGPGAYVPRSGSTRLGANLEAGLEIGLRGRWRLAFGAGYHRIFAGGADAELLDAGLRFILKD